MIAENKKKLLTGNFFSLFVAAASSKLLRRKMMPFSIVTVKYLSYVEEEREYSNHILANSTYNSIKNAFIRFIM